MNREEIIRMARQCGFWLDGANQSMPMWVIKQEELERFAALVAEAAVKESSGEYRLGWNDGQLNEREACAQLCEWYEDYAKGDMNHHATLIRGRGRSEPPQQKVS